MEEAALGCPPGEARLIAASPNQTAVTIVYELSVTLMPRLKL